MTQKNTPPLSPKAHSQLTLLRLDLNQHYANGQLSYLEHTELIAEIDARLSRDLSARGITFDSPEWIAQRQQAWDTLNQTHPLKISVPWITSTSTSTSTVTPEITTATKAPEPNIAPKPAPKKRPRKLTPQAPTATEKLIGKISGWSSLTAPFLMQNIGWFIGGLSFLAGSVFLIANTQGFAKSLAVFSSLFLYSILLSWGGYKLRKKNPDLKASSHFLFILSTLLMPLTLAAGLQMLINATTVITFASGSVLCLLCIGVFYYFSRLAAGVIHAKFPPAYALWFIGLSSIQLTAPLTHAFPTLFVVMPIHLLILIALNSALLTFRRHWLLDLQEHRPYSAIFAAGSLLYAAFVSFAHIQTTLPEHTLPDGYAGLLLILASGLLFYTDYLIKQHWRGVAWVNQYSFMCYAVSFLALFLSWQTPYQFITSACAIGLFFQLAWQYRTWVPFYLASGLTLLGHYTLFLQPLAQTHYLLASLPLMALFYLLGEAVKRSPELQKHVFYLLGLLTMSTAYFSQLAYNASFLGLSHLLLVTALVYLWIQSPVSWLAQQRTQISHYYFPIHSILGLIYLPLFASTWSGQHSLTGLLLCAVWLILCLRHRRHQHRQHAEASVNTAIFILAASLLIGFVHWQDQPLALALLCLCSATLFSIAAIGLHWQMPIYLTFVALAGFALLLKQWALPEYQSQSGAGLTLLGLAIFFLKNQLDKKTPTPKAITTAPMRVLGYAINRDQSRP